MPPLKYFKKGNSYSYETLKPYFGGNPEQCKQTCKWKMPTTSSYYIQDTFKGKTEFTASYDGKYYSVGKMKDLPLTSNHSINIFKYGLSLRGTIPYTYQEIEDVFGVRQPKCTKTTCNDLKWISEGNTNGHIAEEVWGGELTVSSSDDGKTYSFQKDNGIPLINGRVMKLYSYK